MHKLNQVKRGREKQRSTMVMLSKKGKFTLNRAPESECVIYVEKYKHSFKKFHSADSSILHFEYQVSEYRSIHCAWIEVEE